MINIQLLYYFVICYFQISLLRPKTITAVVMLAYYQPTYHLIAYKNAHTTLFRSHTITKL